MSGEEPIRVCHLIGSTGLYGAERWILAQTRYLDRRRVQASIINLVDKPGETSALVVEARNRGHAAFDFYTGGRFNLLAAFRLARVVRHAGYTILHSHGYKSDILAIMAGKVAGVKLISTPHGWSKERDRKLLLYEKLDRICLGFFDRVCPLSPELYDGLWRAGIKKSRLALIRNSVDVQEVDEAIPLSKVDGKKRIGFIGQFIERKSLKDLVEAFFILRRSDCELFLIGDGPCRDGILRRIKSRDGNSTVYCPGFSSDRLGYLKSFDLFVLPSLLEGIPRCIMEAHAAMVPVVGTDIAGIRDLVRHQETGLLVPPRDPATLAKAMNRILESSELGVELAEAGRRLVGDQFSAERMAQEYEALYFSLARQTSQ